MKEEKLSGGVNANKLSIQKQKLLFIIDSLNAELRN